MSAAGQEMLRVAGVCKRLGGRTILDHVDVVCDGGEICVIEGPNGSGKSTLLRVIAGLLEPDRGYVELAGEALAARPVAARRRLGYVPEAADPPGYMTGRELFALVRALKRAEPLSAELQQALGLEGIDDQRIERLSLGQRRRVCLGAALIGDPAVLVLDEPTNGLDRDGVAQLVDILDARRRAGAAVLVATHERGFADAIADRRLRFEGGGVVEEPAGAPRPSANEPQ
ncbi:ABC transporter ATP-binding protein [Haliangium sp.]|uniref:ABC transporter ATP-binding protein n=1 Tax=Haliangium sp. TaxID=2663208 RepID=UPI003D12B809